MGYRLGCVPYINALPLVHLFESQPSLGVVVSYDVPSRLPKMLDSGEADAILVSSYFLAAQNGLAASPFAGIISHGAVESVRLFSKVPFGKIQSLALDESSMTSNALAQIILKERFDTIPECTPCSPDIERMLRDYDACVLIGDIGMATEAPGMHILDLGQAWTDWTSLPFVWALWVGRDGLTLQISDLLSKAAKSFFTGIESEMTKDEQAIIDLAVARSGLPSSQIERYLSEVIKFHLGSAEREGLDTYFELLKKHGFVDHSIRISWVHDVAPTSP